ncbi:MAG: sulfate ABC transporter permease [Planctomycetes bacterium]|nr:sulfate ABC transporter permease [Planctomycetota bacterium]
MPEDPAWVKWTLIAAALAVITLLVIIPLVFVFAQALKEGLAVYAKNLFGDKDTWHSILLTLTVVPAAVAANVVFGVAAAWLIGRFKFPGRSLLITLIDLPFSVSPVVAGLIFVLIFGLQGYLGPWLRDDGLRIVPWLLSFLGAVAAWFVASSRRKSRLTSLAAAALAFALLFGIQEALGLWPRHHSLKIIFATPGLILATAFVTFPFVARELIPVMEALGPEEDLAAVSLGASGWQMFWRVTLPNIKWGLLYGVILCNARAMGEFGAVYVVSGHIAGKTDTMPLRVEKLYQEYNLPGAFAVASVLTLLALVTLVLKARLETKTGLKPAPAPKAEAA